MKNPLHPRAIFVTICLIMALLLSSTVRSQQTLTQINSWNAYVHLPWDYNINTTTKYPTIVFFPGLGEVGTNANLVIANGPGAYITQGWNGNVKVGTDSVKFIVISLQPPSAYPIEASINTRLQTIKSLYRVDPNRLILTGLSHGGWCSKTFVTGDAAAGPYTYATQVAAVVDVEGVKPDDNQPYPNLFDNFANAGGRYLGFEQINDFRDIQTVVNRMNTTKSNSSIYVQTNFSSGGHCCWAQFYGGGGTTPYNFTLDGVTQNIYQWMARQQRVSGSLPLNLVSFSGQKTADGKASLKWVTTAEINTSHFEILRGTQPSTLEYVGRVTAAGNSNANRQYTFTDVPVASGYNYYQLKMVDKDGKYTLSDIVRINFDEMSNISIYPNPVKGKEISVTLDNNMKLRSVTMIDVLGQRFNCDFIAGTMQAKVILPDGIAKGVYNIQLLTDKGNSNSMVVVQ